MNQYNHYWMEAIIKLGWGNQESMINYLNLQNVLYKTSPNVNYNYNQILKNVRLVSSSAVLGSQVISQETEKQNKVNNIEEFMLSFLRNNLHKSPISLFNEANIKKYCWLQATRNPLHYEFKREQLCGLLELENSFIANIYDLNQYEKNTSLTKEDNINSKLQVSINNNFSNSMDSEYFHLKTSDTKVKIINISELNAKFVLGSFTCVSFSSILITNGLQKSVLETFIDTYDINIDNLNQLYGSYLFPITTEDFIFLYKNEAQANILPMILREFIFFHNQLQFEYSSGIVLPIKYSCSSELFGNGKNFIHHFNKQEISQFLNKNLIEKTNKELLKKEVNSYLKDYKKTIEDINLLNILTHSNFDDNKDNLSYIFNDTSISNINFSDILSPEDFKFICQDIFLFSIQNLNYLFFFTKDGTVFYSINNQKMRLFCFNYFDFLYRFFIELASNKLLKKCFKSYHYFLKFKSLIKDGTNTPYKLLTQNIFNRKKNKIPTFQNFFITLNKKKL